MSPNLLQAAQTIVNPKRWFKERPEIKCESNEVEEWQDPVPGIYKRVPGRGWYLTARITYSGDHGEIKTSEPVSPPEHVVYSRVLRQHLFEADYNARKTQGLLADEASTSIDVGLFRVDDVAWVNCWDHDGNFVPGPYRRYVFDKQTQRYRPMTRIDDPTYQRQKRERAAQRARTQIMADPAMAGASEQPGFPRQLTNLSSTSGSTSYSRIWDNETDAVSVTTGATGSVIHQDALPSASSIADQKQTSPAE